MTLETDEKSPYADYDYYQNSYYGTLISESSFPHLELQAEAYITAITFNRVFNLDEVPEAVKQAVCAAAEILKEYQDAHELSGVKSESNDGYSITYGDVSTENDLLLNIKKRVSVYLSGTGLLYRGWSKVYDD